MNALNDWLTTEEAAHLSGYHIEHVRRLIRAGVIGAKKWGRDWMVNRQSMVEYLKQTENLGKRRGPKPN